MRIGVNLPGPFRVSWNVGGHRRRRGRASAGAGCLGVLVLPFLLPWLICVGIAKLYQVAWTKPATTGGKVASVTGVSLGLLVVLVIGAVSGGGSPAPTRVPAAQAAPVTSSAPARLAAPTPSSTHRAAAASTTQMDHSPAPAPSSSSPAPATAAPAPAYVPPSTPAPPAAQQPAPACSPTTRSGHCYEPGEFCPKRDRGLSGTAGDGKPITCENNDGWRWEA